MLSACHVDIVDLKEPLHGPLGCPDFSVAREFSQCFESAKDGTAFSIALGEVANCPLWPEVSAEAAAEVLSRFDFAKFGLSGLGNGGHSWVGRWKEAFARVPESVARVAVAYADWEKAAAPSPLQVVNCAAEVNASVLLVDTFEKRCGLLDLFSMQQIGELVAAARASGLRVALAGSLSAQQAAQLKVACDFVGVRGAICSTDRTSTIDPKRLLELVNGVSHFGHGSPA